VNFDVVKKITIVDGVIALGLGLMVVGIGSKMKEADKPVVVAKVEKAVLPINAVVNVNRATALELESLPAIGPKTAQKIIDYRNKYGSFKSKAALKNVSGIGEKTYEKLVDKIEI